MQKTICSVFFQPVKANRPFAPTANGGYNVAFEIPAAAQGEYHVLTVSDVYELQRNGSQQQFTTPVFADALAVDLVNEWRNNKIANEHGRPGIFVCAGDKPTPEELNRERMIQTVWCEILVNEAESHWVQGKRDLVSELHREAAKWLGREAYNWVHNQGQVSLMACPFCATKIDQTAIVCRECGNVIDIDRWTQAETRKIEAQAKLEKLKADLGVSMKPSAPPPLQPNAPKQVAR